MPKSNYKGTQDCNNLSGAQRVLTTDFHMTIQSSRYHKDELQFMYADKG